RASILRAVDLCAARVFPRLDCDFVVLQLAFARIFQESLADVAASVDGAENIASGTMEKTRNTAEGFTLRPLAASRRTEENERLVFHGGTFFYKTNSTIWATVVPYSLVIPT